MLKKMGVNYLPEHLLPMCPVYTKYTIGEEVIFSPFLYWNMKKKTVTPEPSAQLYRQQSGKQQLTQE
jgi:hypothetical protein